MRHKGGVKVIFLFLTRKLGGSHREEVFKIKRQSAGGYLSEIY